MIVLDGVLDEVFLSIDGEFDGPIPPFHSMLSFASVAFTLRAGIVGTYTTNIKPLDGAVMHPDTERFWKDNHDAYQATLVDQKTPEDAMEGFRRHVLTVVGEENEQPLHRPTVCEYPGGIDFLWLYWYCQRFLGTARTPISFSSDSMKSRASEILSLSFKSSVKRNMPKRWFESNLKHTHMALDDALAQAHLYIRMRCETLKIQLPPGIDTKRR